LSSAASTIHADRNPVFSQYPSKAIAGELPTLVGIEYFALLAFGYIPHRFNTEVGI
jgi:hypothetical protein